MARENGKKYWKSLRERDARDANQPASANDAFLLEAQNEFPDAQSNSCHKYKFYSPKIQLLANFVSFCQ